LTRRSETFEQMLLEARRRRGVALMGVCNVTPDSFSDGGKHFTFDGACEHVDTLVMEGADLVDIGAESTRPGAARVGASDQLGRMLEVVRYAASKACVSVDTTSPDVARACLEAGAVAVNDVSCLADDRLAEVVREAHATLVLMHARGSQVDMRGFSVYPDDAYGDVVEDVVAEWLAAADRAAARGLDRRALVMDPGLGFAKNARQSMELLRRTSELVARLDVPVLVGASRKSFLRLVDPDASSTERIGASIAAATVAMQAGATLLRVHDVRATRQAIDLTRSLGAAAKVGRGFVAAAPPEGAP
jgi:dihydropteroate synthase